MRRFGEVPASEATAEKGRWLKGPGKRFFEALKAEFGELPFIAEDLGFITPGVRKPEEHPRSARNEDLPV
ncbi:MAG: 4-alpha-glucanotransferase [Bacillota bacterium]